MGIFWTSAVFVMIIAVNGVNGQRPSSTKNLPPGWVLFSPPDGSFSVELPKMPTKTSKLNPGSSDETGYFRCTKALESAYKLEISTNNPNSFFDLGVFDVSQCKRKPRDFSNETNRLVKIYAADDDTDQIIKDQSLTVNGYPARLFVTKTGSGVFVWQLFVETKNKIFWLAYDSDDSRGLSFDEPKRIIDSFRLNR
jgi:hypothetical protein